MSDSDQTNPAAASPPAEVKRTWHSTWFASQQPVWTDGFVFPTRLPTSLLDTTFRQYARLSVGGERLKIVLSNDHGTKPVLIGGAGVFTAARDSRLPVGKMHRLKFGGDTQATLPPAGRITSDSVKLETGALDTVAVSLFLPRATCVETFHWDGRQTAYFGGGDLVEAACFPEADFTEARIFLNEILVDAAGSHPCVVAFGDSITDGNGAPPDSNARWPDFLASRLVSRKVSVLNAGISGARMLRDGMGLNALARFPVDVLQRPRVRAVIIMMGINDIGWPGTAFAADESPVTAQQLAVAYAHLIAQARGQGLRVIGGTLPPFEGALPDSPIFGFWTPEKEIVRQQINQWIRCRSEFHEIIDFDQLLRDPDRPTRLRSDVDSGDHLHPSPRGYQLMADLVSLETLL